MSAQIYPPYPPTLTTSEKEYLLSNLKDWSIAHGLAVRPIESFVSKETDPAGALATTAPVTLFPSLFPRTCFEQAKAVSKAYNELYSAISVDEAWLGEICKELLDIDDFIENLWKVHVQVKSEGYVQPIQLGLFRSDYMVHVDQTEGSRPCVKQVEFNTIASSFGGLSNQVSGLHRHLQSIDAYPDALNKIIKDDSLPESTSVPKLALGLARAHAAYESSSSPVHPTCVLFIVQEPERNVFDQRHLEYELNATHSVRTFRLSFNRVLADTRLEPDTRKLLYTPPHTPHKSYEISTLYFRAGYAPTDYTTQEHWTARLHLERSAAIKCPSILTHLAGSKKVQQVLATPQSPHLSRFLPNQTSSASVLETFAPIYPLDSTPAGLTARSLATNPETAVKYVLKPQREGGGNNVYRADIPPFLASLPESHWPAYILMEMIEPPAQANSIFRNGEVQGGDVICELGVYGVCLWKDGETASEREVLENFEAGYLLRTKGAGSTEGGVAAGFGSVDSCCLVDV